MTEAGNVTIVFAIVVTLFVYGCIFVALYFYNKQQDRDLARHREIRAELKRRKNLAAAQVAE